MPWHSQLPKAPEAIAEEAAREGAAKAVAAIAAYEADACVMRELRMILRDVTFRLLTNRRWDAFAEPPTPEDDPENWDQVHASSLPGPGPPTPR